MQTVGVWADALRAVFGADDFNAGLRQFGYFAREGGRTIDTRKLKLGVGIPVSALVISLPSPPKGAHGG